MLIQLSLLSLLWSLVVLEVHSQTVPYVFFLGHILPNHSYVDLSLVGDPLNSDGESIKCYTDLHTCCTGTYGDGRGHWYFPDGTRLPLTGGGDIYERHEHQHILISRRNNANSPSGMYRCDIQTDDDDILEKETVYVGVYATGGAVELHGVALTMDSDLNAPNPQFTLTCNSTGGPATTVTWTRDSVTVTEGTETVLDDPVTAQYTHTLTGSIAGVYTCTVTNHKPSVDLASLTVQGPSAPTNVMAVQEGPTTIRVSWTPSSGATGYRIDYTSSDGSSDSVTVSGGSTDNYLLIGLHNGDTYTISIIATSRQSISDLSQSVIVHLLETEPDGTSGSQTGNTGAVAGGVVVAVVFMITTAVIVLAIVVLVLRYRRGADPTSTQKSEAVSNPASVQELSKVSRKPTDSNVISTSTNDAYVPVYDRVTTWTREKGEEEEDDTVYEIVSPPPNEPPSTSHSS